jgi:ribosome maturation factor RimP
MSGSSRHGGARPPAPASRGRSAARPGPGSKPGSGTGNGSGRPALPPVDADRVAALAEPVVHAAGLDLEGVRVTAAGRRRLLRLVVDGDGGVTLDDIALVSREVSAVLDGSPVMGEHPYTLEVSSPGVDRPLTERRHWRRAVGRLVTAPPVADGAPVIEGRITAVGAAGITLDVAGETRQFGYGELGPGRIKIEFAPLSGEDEDDGTGSADEGGADEEGTDGY